MSKEYLQLDIFGEAKPLSEVISSTKPLLHGGRITKKSLFRSINGYKKYFKKKISIEFKMKNILIDEINCSIVIL